MNITLLVSLPDGVNDNHYCESLDMELSSVWIFHQSYAVLLCISRHGIITSLNIPPVLCFEMTSLGQSLASLEDS